MKVQVRRSVFETNSSSVHSMTMCTESDYDKWRNGEFVFDRYNDELIPITDKIKKSMDDDDDNNNQYITYNHFFDYRSDFNNDFEVFEKSHTTQSGETVVAFGYYGYDG